MPDPAGPPPDPDELAPRTPPPLTVAASVVAAQGLVLVLLAIVELASTSAERASIGVSTAVFFAAYGVALLGSGLALWRRVSWVRGPALMTQFIALGLAWNAGTGWDQPAVAVVLALSALIALAGIVHPDSVTALTGAEPADRVD